MAVITTDDSLVDNTAESDASLSASEIAISLERASGCRVLPFHPSFFSAVPSRVLPVVRTGRGRGGTDGGSLHLGRLDAVRLLDEGGLFVGDGLFELLEHLDLARLILRWWLNGGWNGERAGLSFTRARVVRGVGICDGVGRRHKQNWPSRSEGT